MVLAGTEPAMVASTPETGGGTAEVAAVIDRPKSIDGGICFGDDPGR